MVEPTNSNRASFDNLAGDALLPLVYEELRKLAAVRLAHENAGQTLQPTALVHEAYMRLVGDAPTQGWENRRHFFSAAAEAMRRILIERARRRASLKHGGARERIDVDVNVLPDGERGVELLELDEALNELEGYDAQAAELVKLRYFAGLTLEEAGNAL